MTTVIKIEELSKEYQLGLIGHGTLYRDLQSLWAKLLNKEDPNTLLGSNQSNVKNKILALDNINLEIQRGEILGIIGHNGAGKSTLLKVLSRITSPSQGVIKVKGRVSSLLEVGTGFHSELTGRENIYLNGAINGLSINEVSKKIDEIIDFAGVESFLDTPIKRYSSGMHVRLSFAVAAHLDPDILVVDEVLAVGDASFQKKAMNKIEEVSQKNGRTILFVSHNLQAIENFCTKTLLLKKGRIEKIGDTKEIINFYAKGNNNFKIIEKELIFKRDESKKFQILKLSIFDNKKNLSNYINRTESFILSLNYLVSKTSKDFKINVSITTYGEENGVQNNTTVFQWSEQHYNKLKKGSEDVFKNIGTYNVEIDIPAYILNSGQYKFSVGIDYATNPYEFIDGIIFELYDPDTSHSLKSGRSAGLLAIPLNWREKKIS